MCSRPKVHSFIASLILALGLICPGYASCQQLTLVHPSSRQAVVEGDDFAVNQLQNAWDFNQRRDIGFEVNYTDQSISVSNGIWKGVSVGTGAYVFPLFGGFFGALQAEGLAGDLQLPRFGAVHPIPASKYKMLSFRMRQSNRGSLAVYWDSNPTQSYFPDGANFGADFDGFFLDQPYLNTGFNIYSYDLSSGGFDQRGGSWAGNVYALRIDPAIGAASGSTTEFDWIRLVDPSSAPQVEVCWNISGITSQSLITIWADNNVSGYDGTPLARLIHNPSTGNVPGPCNSVSGTGGYRFSSAILPPGNYYFYVTVSRSIAGSVVELARSGYSSELFVNSAPKSYFTTPSQLTGSEYSATELANSWEMSSSQDVANLNPSINQLFRQFSNASFVNGIFQATADVPVLGNAESDVQVHLPVSPGRPIVANRYRYLTYRLGADSSQYPSISDKVSNGWVTRPVFWNDNVLSQGGTAKAHVLYEGMNTYTIDLWDSQTIESGIPWLSLSSVLNLRIDPLETTLPTWFFLDWVALSGETYAAGSYPVSWVIDDPDSTDFSVTLNYDLNASGFDGTRIASLSNLQRGFHQYQWNTAGLSAGRYFLYLEIFDGANLKKVYAPVPIVVGQQPGGPSQSKVAYDYDGDGKSDRSIYRPFGQFYLQQSSAGIRNHPFGSTIMKPVRGDFDGDNRADLAVIQDHAGFLTWFILSSKTGFVRTQGWGLSGDIPAVGDYDGNGTDDIAVFRQGIWYIVFADGTTRIAPWGVAGDIPVPGDYDGDLKADYAIWRPITGTWWVLNSGYSGDGSPPYHTAQQWGLPGDIPVPYDYDADKRIDFALWRPALGMWFILKSSTATSESWQWGLPGDVPVVGDFLGNQQGELTVWRPALGMWFHLNRSNGSSSAQWGLPGDIVGW